MKEYEIWSEGYAATGEHGTARFQGKSFGETFEDAVNNFRYPDDVIREWDGKILYHKGEKLNLDKKGYAGRPSIWGCRLFDNETDARKSFG